MNKKTKRVIALEPAKIEEGFTIEFAALLKSQPQLFRLAVREAEAIAWQTPFPALVLPSLLEEKLGKASRWHFRQANLRSRANESSFAA